MDKKSWVSDEIVLLDRYVSLRIKISRPLQIFVL